MTASATAVEVRSRGPWPLYPSLLAAAFILNIWVEADISPYAMFRSLAVGAAVPFAFALVAGTVLRNRHVGGAISGGLVVGLVGWRNQELLLVLAILICVTVLLIRRIRHAPVPWPSVTFALNVMAAALLVALAVKAGMHGTYGQALADLRQGTSDIPPAGAADTLPDIYVLLLDGHPRVDRLKEVFGIDGEPFLGELEARGFDVSRKSRSNYGVTQLTLVSMLNMRLVQDIPQLDPVIRGEREPQPLMRNLANDSTAFRILRDRGYRILATGSGFEETALRQADIYLDGGELNEFELLLMRFTGVAQIVDGLAPAMIGDSFRARVMAAPDLARQAVATAMAGPQLAILHVPSPHGPILFDADGSPLRVAATHPYDYELATDASPDIARAAYGGHIAVTDDLTVRAIDAILTGSSTPPIILVMSDHGARANGEMEADQLDAEAISNLFAAFTPGHSGLFGDTVTPVNVFPVILDRYLGTALPRSPDDSFVTDVAKPFDFIRISAQDAEPSSP